MFDCFQLAVPWMLALMLAIGPSYCRQQCQAASVETAEPVVSCCQAAAPVSSTTNPPGESDDCCCQMRDVVIDARGPVVDIPSPVLLANLSLVVLDEAHAAPRGVACAADISPPVALHVLKCVWRC